MVNYYTLLILSKDDRTLIKTLNTSYDTLTEGSNGLFHISTSDTNIKSIGDDYFYSVLSTYRSIVDKDGEAMEVNLNELRSGLEEALSGCNVHYDLAEVSIKLEQEQRIK